MRWLRFWKPSDVDDGRPRLHALVGWFLPDGDVIVKKQPVLLEDAADYARMGWAVVVDPSDQAHLARWLQLNRSLEKPRQW